MLTIIRPFCGSAEREIRLNRILDSALAETGIMTRRLSSAEELRAAELRGERLIFAVCLTEGGNNLECFRMLEYLRSEADCLAGCCAGVIVDGGGELFTKSMARQLVLAANAAGCTFPGKPLVEATGSLYNLKIMSKVLGMEPLQVYRHMTCELLKKVQAFQIPQPEQPNILAVHASSRKTSNSLLLWEMIKKEMGNRVQITEVSLRNGSLQDCRGCSYEECLHFGENGSCFYGGVIVEKVYPAIVKCDTLVMICPNYNDAVSANITAFINRLTAVFRTNDFSRKRIFSLVISGYSGGDIVAEQVLGAMNLNKNFILPAGFAMIETANDPGSIREVEDLEKKAGIFAGRIAPHRL